MAAKKKKAESKTKPKGPRQRSWLITLIDTPETGQKFLTKKEIMGPLLRMDAGLSIARMVLTEPKGEAA